LGTVALSSPFRDEPRDALDMPPRRQLSSAAPRTVKFMNDAATEASEHADRNYRGSLVVDANDLRPGYSSSAAHLTPQENGSLRWHTLCVNVCFTHDCEYIARHLPQHFVVYSMHHSNDNPCTPRLLQCAGAHTWRILAAAFCKSLQLKHALLQVHQTCIRWFLRP
jgi:hypothetical protein